MRFHEIRSRCFRQGKTHSSARECQEHDANVGIGFEVIQYDLTLCLGDFSIKTYAGNIVLFQSVFNYVESEAPSGKYDTGKFGKFVMVRSI